MVHIWQEVAPPTLEGWGGVEGGVGEGGGGGWGGEVGGGGGGGVGGGGSGEAVHTQGGAHKRRCTQKAVCSHRRSLVIEGGVRGLAPVSSVASRSPVHYRMPLSFTRGVGGATSCRLSYGPFTATDEHPSYVLLARAFARYHSTAFHSGWGCGASSPPYRGEGGRTWTCFLGGFRPHRCLVARAKICASLRPPPPDFGHG